MEIHMYDLRFINEIITFAIYVNISLRQRRSLVDDERVATPNEGSDRLCAAW